MPACRDRFSTKEIRMSQTQTQTLNLLGLEGVTIDPQQYGFVASATQAADGSYTVGAGEGDLTDNSIFSSADPAGTLAFHAFLPSSQPSSKPVGPYYVVSALQNGNSLENGHAGNAPRLLVLGWNAHSILAVNPFPDSPTTTYIIISDQDLTEGEPSDTHFSTDASVPPPFGLEIIPTIVPCFAAGTRIATPCGGVAVEDLREGDLVLTLSGTAQPVCWAGHTAVHAAAASQPARVMPVRVTAGSFGAGLPVRDLVLSPEHAVFAGGALVPVHCLVNGTTIRQETVDAISYYHIELPRHDVLFAEGLPAESYLDSGNRDMLIRRASMAQAA
jgi:hypothetical protein